MPNTPKITEAEWQVMNVVWERSGVTAQDVVQELASQRNWSDRTVKTLLSRLVKKGVLDYEVDGKRYLYSAKVTREQSLATEGRSLLGRFRGAPVSPFLTWFVQNSDLDKDEIDALKCLLDKKERGL